MREIRVYLSGMLTFINTVISNIYNILKVQTAGLHFLLSLLASGMATNPQMSPQQQLQRLQLLQQLQRRSALFHKVFLL